ncbi:MAG: 30S ribosomal protein S17 [Alphaproteobacteria bacterium]|nr:MAG: 30S ribosomal protein S17 [Alphaproteobacteria bacterium]
MPRRTLTGVVVSNKCDKSVVVNVSRRVTHEKYKKIMTKSKRYMAHDEQNSCNIGDLVTIIEIAPKSKRKTWEVMSNPLGEQK